MLLALALIIGPQPPAAAGPAPGDQPLDVSGQRDTPPLGLMSLMQTARRGHPALRAAVEQWRAERAAGEVVRAGLLPQLQLAAQYRRSTANFVARPGSLPQSLAALRASQSNDTDNFFAMTLGLNQLLYDFGRTSLARGAQRLQLEGSANDQVGVLQQVLAEVCARFFAVRAKQAQLQVQARALVNQRRHLALAKSSVEAGIKAPIELAQASTRVAAAHLAWVQARGLVDEAKVHLLVAAARPPYAPTTIAQEGLGPLPFEALDAAVLADRALAARPQLKAARCRLAAQQAKCRGGMRALAPTLNLVGELSEAGRQLHRLAGNWYVGLSFDWQLFSGLADRGRWRQAAAEAAAQAAQLAQQEQEVVATVLTAQLAVHGARAALVAAGDAQASAAAQLRQAEGRFASGVGSFLELDDAQVAATEAEGRLGGAGSELAAARAALAAQLGDFAAVEAALVAEGGA